VAINLRISGFEKTAIFLLKEFYIGIEEFNEELEAKINHIY
jgi:hypothetical protein